MIQGSEEWFAARLGKVTASRVADVIARTKSGYGASRQNYMAELIAERLTGQPADRYTNDAMRWGTEHEAEARAAYEFVTGNTVTEVGFIEHPTIPMSGASPDGLVGDDGLVEIKCPNTATHIDTLLSGTIPLKYITQMQWQLTCARRSFCDFVSYDPRLPPEMRLFVGTVAADALLTYPTSLEREVEAFLAELSAKVAALQERFGEAA